MNFAAFFTGEWRKTKDRIKAVEDELRAKVDADMEALDKRIAGHYNGRVTLLESRVSSLAAEVAQLKGAADGAQKSAAGAMTAP